MSLNGVRPWRERHHLFAPKTDSMASKRVFRACKLQGLSLRADALQRLTRELAECVCCL